MPRRRWAKARRVCIMLPSENPPIGKRRSAKIIKNPIDDRDKYVCASRSGKRREKILLPSSGGIGIKLKIAKRRLSCAIIKIIVEISGEKSKM